MKAGTLLKIEAEATSMIAAGLFNATDDPVTPSPAQIAAIAANVEGVFVAHGVAVPVNVDRVIKLLPVILGLFGSSAPPPTALIAGDLGSPFAPAHLAQTIQSALGAVPDGKTFVGLVRATLHGGIETQMAVRLGDHWELGGSFEYHGDRPSAGSVQGVFSF
jgi:hypothetical protein